MSQIGLFPDASVSAASSFCRNRDRDGRLNPLYSINRRQLFISQEKRNLVPDGSKCSIPYFFIRHYFQMRLCLRHPVSAGILIQMADRRGRGVLLKIQMWSGLIVISLFVQVHNPISAVAHILCKISPSAEQLLAVGKEG